MDNLFHRPQIVKTRLLRHQNPYTLALDGEFKDFAFNEERAPLNRGIWRTEVFKQSPVYPVDLEIGTGNGVHFRHRCQAEPARGLVGIELKYKPLIQTIRGARRLGLQNGRVCRIHAFNIDEVFAPQEVNDIFIHFPDPWTSPRKPKNRLVNPRMGPLLFELQRPGSKLELKTDSLEFFEGAVEILSGLPYKNLLCTRDWHQEPASQGVLRTQFEKIFAGEGLPIYYGLWLKP